MYKQSIGKEKMVYIPPQPQAMGMNSSRRRGTPRAIPKTVPDVRQCRNQAEQMVTTIAVVTQQHLVPIIGAGANLARVVSRRNPGGGDDRGIKVQQVTGCTVLGMILNGAPVGPLEHENTGRSNGFHPQDKTAGGSVKSVMKLTLQVHIVSHLKLTNLGSVAASASVGIAKSVAMLRYGKVLHRHGHDAAEESRPLGNDYGPDCGRIQIKDNIGHGRQCCRKQGMATKKQEIWGEMGKRSMLGHAITHCQVWQCKIPISLVGGETNFA